MPGTALSPRARMLSNTVSISASQLVGSVPWLSTASATKNKRNDRFTHEPAASNLFSRLPVADIGVGPQGPVGTRGRSVRQDTAAVLR
jgi:hypothetical protein